MKCLTRACGHKVYKIEEWINNPYIQYAKAYCNHCMCKYWLINRKGIISLRDRKEDDFPGNRKNKR